MTTMSTSISRADIERVHAVIAPYIRRTPVVEIDGGDVGAREPRVTFKLELLQRAGSFKVRGAFTNLLTRDIPEPGVVPPPGGNHGAAAPYAAMHARMPAPRF